MSRATRFRSAIPIQLVSCCIVPSCTPAAACNLALTCKGYLEAWNSEWLKDRKWVIADCSIENLARFR
jgi:hypothetical protein